MRFPGIFAIWLLVLLAAPSSWADDQGCFNFDKPKTLELPKLAPKLALPASGAKEAMGEDSRIGVWAGLRTRIAKPIQAVYELSRDHRIVKNMCLTELNTDKEKKSGFLEFHRLSISANVWSFITVDWYENWAYQLLEGSASKPKRVRAYYQKLKGSSNIRHLCGVIDMKAIDAKNTDVYFYEEVKATRVDAGMTLGKHQEAVRKIKGETTLECSENAKKKKES